MGEDTKQKVIKGSPTVPASDEAIDRLVSDSEGVRVCGACLQPPETDGEFCGHCGAKLVTIRRVKDLYLGVTVGEKYRVVEKIGQGGMGEVYLAVNDELDQKVAVKFLSKRFADDENVVLRFLNEARSYCRVNHPNAVTLLEFGQHEDGALYIITEFIEGKSITETLKALGPLSVEQSVDIGIQVAEVLDAAHEQGVIHRDLKPDNIMLIQSKRGRFNVKVLDFGIAKIVDDEYGPDTETGSVFGTPEFMSPEQARGDVADPRSDIYAFGIILFYILTGRLPFRGDNKLVVLNKQLHESPPRPSSVRDEIDVPESFEKIILRCLEKEPKYRYQNAEEVLEALETYRADGAAFLTSMSSVSSAESIEPSEAENTTETPEPLRFDTVRFGEAQTIDAGSLDTPIHDVAGDSAADLQSIEMWREAPQSGLKSTKNQDEAKKVQWVAMASIVFIMGIILGGSILMSGDDGPTAPTTEEFSNVLTEGQVLGMLAAAEQLIASGDIDEAQRALETTYEWSAKENASAETETRRNQIAENLMAIEKAVEKFNSAPCYPPNFAAIKNLSVGLAKDLSKKTRNCRLKKPKPPSVKEVPISDQSKPKEKETAKQKPVEETAKKPTKKPVKEKPSKKPVKKKPTKKPVEKKPEPVTKEETKDGLPPKLLDE